ncbi:MAG: hypothetical protein WC759_01070 [Candidatus Micrarchaeia archaeon]
MSDKFETGAILTALLLLVMVTMLAGCSQQSAPAPQAPAVTGPQAGTPVIGGTETVGQQPAAEPNIPSSEGMPSVPTGSPQANNTAPSTGTPSPNGGAQPSTNPTTSPAPTEPERLGVALPEDPALTTARFIVTIPQNTPVTSKVFLEAYNIKAGTWKAYEMQNNESLLGWNVVIDLGASGGVDNSDNTFKYRYSRTGDYSTAEKFAFDSNSAYRTRSIADIAGKFVQDQVTEWRG